MRYLEPSVARRLPGGAGSAAEQLAAGEAMLAGVAVTGVPSLRWYSFEPPALLLGSGQRPDEVDLDACRRAGVDVYRRGSGGGAVLGRSLLLVDVALPRTHALFRSDVTESYSWLGSAWRDALAALGLAARTAEVGEARADAARLDPLLRRVCFGGLSPYEVVVGRRKIVGLAQRRRYGGALFQAALYCRWEPRASAALIAATPDQRDALAARLEQRVAGLDAFEATARLAPSDVVAAVEGALPAALELVDAAWLPAERAAGSAASERFRPHGAGA